MDRSIERPDAHPTLCIIGLGLIGGSLAAALKANGFAGTITAWVRSPGQCRTCTRASACRPCARDAGNPPWHRPTSSCCAVPMQAMPDLLEQLGRSAADDAIITDAGSVKSSFITAARRVLPSMARVVPGHPIAGREKTGVEAADATLFVGRRVLLTPVEETEPAAIDVVRRLWELAGAQRRMSGGSSARQDPWPPTSHLPHVVAFALVDALATRQEAEEIFRYAAGGFRDFTRIASSDAIMWRDICLTNRAAIGDAIADPRKPTLGRLRDAIAEGDGEAIESIFRRARRARESTL